MRQLIAGNWKMHCLMAEAIALAKAIAAGCGGTTGGTGADLLVCPTALHVAAVADALRGSPVATGGQDCHAATHGAHTGDIAAPMLKDAGAGFVILGHSERRQNHHETDAQVREKTMAALAAGLTPIVCVGETEAERGVGRALAVVGAQIAGSLPDPFTGVVAYEPIWAIGTGRTATEADVQAMHAFIRSQLVKLFGPDGRRIRILYGGSVRPSNAASLLAIPEVGGALIGGASLKADDFLAIAGAAQPG